MTVEATGGRRARASASTLSHAQASCPSTMTWPSSAPASARSPRRRCSRGARGACSCSGRAGGRPRTSTTGSRSRAGRSRSSSGSSPAWSRVLVELAQSQTFRRRTVALDPMFQVLAPKLRLEVPARGAALRQGDRPRLPRGPPRRRRALRRAGAHQRRGRRGVREGPRLAARQLLGAPRDGALRGVAAAPRRDAARPRCSPSSRATTTTAPSSTSRRASRATPSTSRTSPWRACTARGRAA